MEVASLGPHLPGEAKPQIVRSAYRGLEQPAHTSVHHVRRRRPKAEQTSVPPPPPPDTQGTYNIGMASSAARARQHQLLRALNSPIGLATRHPGTAALLGPAEKAARNVGWRKGDALTQPNPTPPSIPPKVFELIFVPIEILGQTSGTAGAGEVFPGTWQGVKLFIPPICVYTKCSNHIGDIKSSA